MQIEAYVREDGSTPYLQWFNQLRRERNPSAPNGKERKYDADRRFQAAVVARVQRGPDFANALLDEATKLFLSGEPGAARLMLREPVHATVGFEQLAHLTHRPSESLHRMLSLKGTPSMDNLAAIFDAVRGWLKVSFAVRVVEAT